jgi:hypothetical protein
MPHFATKQAKVPRQNTTSFTAMRGGWLQRKCACGSQLGPTGECEECRKNRESKNDQFSEVPPIVHEVLNSPGQQLDSATRAFMEPRFGHDFGNVRVHTDAKAAESTRAVQAHAYTVGGDVVFGRNQFAPGTHLGCELLAHELAHTIQQQGGLGAAQRLLRAPSLEARAEQAGRAVSSGRALEEPLGRAPLAVARQPTVGDEEEEEATQVPMALAIGRAARSSAAGPRKSPPRRLPPSQFDPGGFHVPVREGGRILTEYEEALETGSKEEKERTERKNQKELEKSLERLRILRGMLDPSLTGYIYTKAQIMELVTKDSLLDGQILRHYGVELPPGRSTKQKTFTDDVIDAIDKFDSEQRHGAPVLSPTDVKGLQARQSQQEGEAAAWEGYSYTTESALAGAGASATRLFTDDPKKIAAGAGLGAATAGSLGAPGYAKGQQGAYSPQVEGPGPFADPVGPWRYSGPAPTTSAPAPPPAPESPVTAPAPPSPDTRSGETAQAPRPATTLSVLQGGSQYSGKPTGLAFDADLTSRSVRVGASHPIFKNRQPANDVPPAPQANEMRVAAAAKEAADMPKVVSMHSASPAGDTVEHAHMGPKVPPSSPAAGSVGSDVQASPLGKPEPEPTPPLGSATETASRSPGVTKAPVPRDPVWVQLPDGTFHEFDTSEAKGALKPGTEVQTPRGAAQVVGTTAEYMQRGGKVGKTPVPKDPVWVQLPDGTIREFDAAEVKGAVRRGTDVQTPDGAGKVVGRGEPPMGREVKQPNVEPGGQSYRAPALMTADELNEFVLQSKSAKERRDYGAGVKPRRLEKIERDTANVVLDALRDVNSGDAAAMNRVARLRPHEWTSGEFKGWWSVDLFPGNPGGLNTMRIYFRQGADGSFEAIIRQGH